MLDQVLFQREIRLAEEWITDDVGRGKIQRFVETSYLSLNQFFTLSIQGVDWLGRKILRKDPKGRWVMSSIISPRMLLGRLHDMQFASDEAFFYYHAASSNEKNDIFYQALHVDDAELRFPFPVLSPDWKEMTMTDMNWNCTQSLAHQLDADEMHFREYCVEFLSSYLQSGAIIYDPACSTGKFIHTLAEAMPDCDCIGSDISPSMIAYAKMRSISPSLQLYVANAKQPIIGENVCDVLILRFLNAEVLTRRNAEELFRILINAVKPQGMIIIFGHTPVLLSILYLAQEMGLIRHRCLGARLGRTELFQFYVLQKK